MIVARRYAPRTPLILAHAAAVGLVSALPAIAAGEAPTEATSPIVGPAITTGLQGHDLSPWGMFMAADYVVKTVMVGLVVACVVTLIIFVAKSMELAAARTVANRTLREVVGAESLAAVASQVSNRRGTGALLVQAAAEEMTLSRDLVGKVDPAGIKERVASRLNRIEVAAGRRISKSLGVLASVGSVGPFVGLFGTVWGIMNAFVGIAESQTTNLAVVAPGIAEALLATACGLVAAIPAVVIYNAFARSVTGYRQLLADVSAGIERLVSRDLDRMAAGGPAASKLAAE
jgi:biopolymer transport protein ExbB